MKKNLIERLLDLDSLSSLSKRADAYPLQDPFRIRARYLGWKAASLLLDEKGELKKEVLSEFFQALDERTYPVGEGDSDTWMFQHLRVCLKELEQNLSLQKALKKCSLPLCSKEAEDIVRDTLWPDEIDALTSAHVRRAALTAWLTLLRQATGSCFATAPAILIQSQEPLRLLYDLDAILSAGELRRGAYAVPLHPGSGPGDLQKQVGSVPLELSPGIVAAFHAAGVPIPRVFPQGIYVKRLFTESLLAHFGLLEEDLAKESATLAPQLGIFWERHGGHYSGASPKAGQIRAWEKALAKAERAFLSVADCALLRAWEYTLASFSDVKVEFARWNLFHSLGLSHEAAPPGIGAALLRSTQEQLDAANSRIGETGREYKKAVQAVHAAERLLERALSEGERAKLKAELYAEAHIANSLSGKIEEERRLAQGLSTFYSQFIKEAAEKLQLSFQEVFDPAIGEANEERLEDSLAGFRLLYKSGRSAAASWERLDDEAQFVQAVFKFFESIEREIRIEPLMKSCFTTIVTELLQYIRSDAFLAGALERAKRNKNGSPWAYESGGTMQTLLQSYYEAPVPFEEFSQPIRSPRELYAFVRKAAEKATRKRHLMLSPTHAFLFCPTLLGPIDSLETNPIPQLKLAQAEFLLERLADTLPPEARPLFAFGCRQQGGEKSLAAFRSQLLAGWRAALQPHPNRVDAFLYEAFPLFTPEEAGPILERIRQRLQIQTPIQCPQQEILLSRDLIRILKKSLIQDKGPFSSTDWGLELAATARIEGACISKPLLFGDTNWSSWSFGLVKNVATSEVELWRLSRTGLSGFPMTEWNPVFREGGRWSMIY